MNTKSLFTFAFVILSSDFIYGNQKVNVSLYYETLCEESIYLIRNQIYPTWSLLKNYLNISLVPFGKAVHNKDEYGNWTFNCQHGSNECIGNRIQACGLDVLNDNNSQSVPFVACYMNENNVLTRNKTCFDLVVGADELEKKQKFYDCIDSRIGDDILAFYGDLTFNVTPSITSVPTLSFNGVYNYDLQTESKHNFQAVVCRLLKDKPRECTNKIAET